MSREMKLFRRAWYAALAISVVLVLSLRCQGIKYVGTMPTVSLMIGVSLGGSLAEQRLFGRSESPDQMAVRSRPSVLMVSFVVGLLILVSIEPLWTSW